MKSISAFTKQTNKLVGKSVRIKVKREESIVGYLRGASAWKDKRGYWRVRFSILPKNTEEYRLRDIKSIEED